MQGEVATQITQPVCFSVRWADESIEHQSGGLWLILFGLILQPGGWFLKHAHKWSTWKDQSRRGIKNLILIFSPHNNILCVYVAVTAQSFVVTQIYSYCSIVCKLLQLKYR